MSAPGGLTQAEWDEYIDIIDICDNMFGYEVVDKILWGRVGVSLDYLSMNKDERWFCSRLVKLKKKKHDIQPNS